MKFAYRTIHHYKSPAYAMAEFLKQFLEGTETSGLPPYEGASRVLTQLFDSASWKTEKETGKRIPLMEGICCWGFVVEVLKEQGAASDKAAVATEITYHQETLAALTLENPPERGRLEKLLTFVRTLYKLGEREGTGGLPANDDDE